MNDYKDFQREFYTRSYSWRPKYKLNAWRNSYIRRIKDSILDKNYRKKILIDIGTGAGYVAVEMAKLGLKKVIAQDIL